MGSRSLVSFPKCWIGVSSKTNNKLILGQQFRLISVISKLLSVSAEGQRRNGRAVKPPPFPGGLSLSGLRSPG